MNKKKVILAINNKFSNTSIYENTKNANTHLNKRIFIIWTKIKVIWKINNKF